MTSVRTVRPTDLVALVAFDGRVYPNEAVTRDRIGKEISPHPELTADTRFHRYFLNLTANGRSARLPPMEAGVGRPASPG